MARITNWTKAVDKNVSETANGGFVKEWRHRNTGDKITVQLCDERYNILHNGNVVTARSTLKDARDCATMTAKNKESGF